MITWIYTHKRVFLILLVMIELLGCGETDQTDLLMEVRFVPTRFDARNEETLLKYTLAEAAEVHIAIYDSAGGLVLRLVDGQRESEGSHALGWSGRDAEGNFVDVGLYVATVEADGDQVKVAVQIVQ